jgi:hypothetical protein
MAGKAGFTMMDRRVFGFGAIATLAFAAPVRVHARAPKTLSEVLDRHTRARGGARAIEAINSQDTQLTIMERGSALDARYRCNKAPMYRIDIFASSRHVFAEGLDRKGVWLWPDGTPEATDGVPDARRTALQGIEFNLYGLHQFSSRGHKLTLLGRETIGLTSYYVIQIEMIDGYETVIFLDPDTWLVAHRRDFRAFHPDMDATRKNTDNFYRDYRAVNGVLTAFYQEQSDRKTASIINTTTVKRMEYNQPLRDADFDRAARPLASVDA